MVSAVPDPAVLIVKLPMLPFVRLNVPWAGAVVPPASVTLPPNALPIEPVPLRMAPPCTVTAVFASEPLMVNWPASTFVAPE